MQMMEQHGHHNNALCFYSKDLPALILFIPSKHYDVCSLGIYWTFIQYPFFFFEQVNFWASVVWQDSCSNQPTWDFSNDPLKSSVFLHILGPLF